MKFVHLIEVNDPLNPFIEPLSREQVWRGLLLRAEQPGDFLPQLNACRVIARGENQLARELDFGSFKVRDRIRFIPMQQMIHQTEAARDVPAATLVITIEEPGSEQLQVRFEYDIERPRQEDEPTEAMYDRFVKGAYLEADIDCVRIIRQRIAEGMI